LLTEEVASRSADSVERDPAHAARILTLVSIEPYSDSWPEEFRRVAGRLRSLLGERALRIDHVGSTAVPGLAAKDLVDVQITVATLADADPLARAGFDEYAYSDHRPPGASGPVDDWQKRFFVPPAPERRTNLHVREQGRANQRYALLFRDYLRAHPHGADAYAELKRRLAATLADPSNYSNVKEPAWDLIALAAEDWAAATNWDAGVPDA
jgi:GrpB-like predicted nucleotidyltransferase (UPF0157 family)